MPKQFRKKPVVIEAMQYQNTRESADAIQAWLKDMDGNQRGTWFFSAGHFVVYTLEGNMVANPGDWIIRGIKGEFYPCKPHIFDATYEEVSDAT